MSHVIIPELTIVDLSTDQEPAKFSIQKNIDYLVDSILQLCNVNSLIVKSKRSFMCLSVSVKSFNIEDEGDFVGNHIIKSISKIVNVEDKYMALCSLLLKSWIWYKVRKFSNQSNDYMENKCNIDWYKRNNRSIKLPVVEFPRTVKGKPFIPKYPGKNNKKKWKRNSYFESHPVSISHQFPYVALANVCSPSYMSMNSSKLKVMVGLDIVKFDSFHGISSVDEYLNMFRQKFTIWEWEKILMKRDMSINKLYKKLSSVSDMPRWKKNLNRFIKQPFSYINKKINNNCLLGGGTTRLENDKLREFFLRWATKEAYTKAVGLGVNMAFDTFEVRLLGIDDMHQKICQLNTNNRLLSDGLWNYIVLHNKFILPNNRVPTVLLNGFITRYSSCGIIKELWKYIYIPLAQGIQEKNERKMSCPYNGCACVCFGPIHDRKAWKYSSHYLSVSNISLKILTLEDLILFHLGN